MHLITIFCSDGKIRHTTYAHGSALAAKKLANDAVKVFAWREGRTSFTSNGIVNSWDYARLATDEEVNKS